MSHQWYILNAVSGFEKRVVSDITEQARKRSLQECVEKIVIPTEEFVEVKRGQKVVSEKKFLPGYILIKADMNDALCHMIKNVNKVIGFLGGGSGNPIPVGDAEIQRVMKHMEEGVTSDSLNFEIGESVKVTDGPFESFLGVVTDVDVEKARLKVSVTIFGRSTPIDLEFIQVEKV